jgi:hypothetical protein
VAKCAFYWALRSGAFNRQGRKVTAKAAKNSVSSCGPGRFEREYTESDWRNGEMRLTLLSF